MKYDNLPPLENNVPLPIPRLLRDTTPLYDALMEMQVGQSRFIPTEKPDSTRSYVSKWGIRHKRSFTTRTREVDGKIGLRVWRTR